jgi:hypothetical protein
MDTLEVFALNIQPRQIASLLTIDERKKPENIEKERQHFLSWLRDMALGGAKFLDQLSAWNTYCLYIEYDLFDEIEDDEWETPVVETVFGNYEQRSRHGLPSQM